MTKKKGSPTLYQAIYKIIIYPCSNFEIHNKEHLNRASSLIYLKCQQKAIIILGLGDQSQRQWNLIVSHDQMGTLPQGHQSIKLPNLKFFFLLHCQRMR